MSDQDNLRDRIADILEALDGMDLDQQAQAIIDDLGLTHGYRTAYNRHHPDGENQKRVVGKWEKK